MAKVVQREDENIQKPDYLNNGEGVVRKRTHNLGLKDQKKLTNVAQSNEFTMSMDTGVSGKQDKKKIQQGKQLTSSVGRA